MRNKAVWGILILVFFFFAILMIFALYTVNIFKDNSQSSFLSSGSGAIAVIEVEGAILASKNTIEKLHTAEKDEEIKAIIMRINSPGGAVGPVQEIYQEIIRIDKVKPVYASFGTVAASGGYYLGAAARRIYSNPGTLTGSIGVIMHFFDLSKLYKLAKVNSVPIKSGKYKDIGNPSRPLSNEEKDILTDVINEVHKQFVGDILKRRKKKLKEDIWKLAQGQIFSGEGAFKLGLVDRLGSLWQAGREIHQELKIKGPFGFKFIKKRKKISFWELLDHFDEAISHFAFKARFSPTFMFLYK